MKKILLFSLVFSCLVHLVKGQVLCVHCFDQNDEISSGVNNRLLNGGFENTTCTPGWLADSYCPNSTKYNCDIEHWTCTGGDAQSYPSIFDSTLSLIPEGNNAAYFGNGNAFTCSGFWGDFACITSEFCTVAGFPLGFPHSLPGYGEQIGISLEQTVSGLTIGHTYVLEFWAGGEPLQGLLPGSGIFAVDVGFGNIFLTCKPTDETHFPIGTVYIIEFTATSVNHTIKFTNWGHVCDECTELVIDDVRLYTIEELSNVVPACMTSTDETKETGSISLIPNPFTSQLTLRSDLQTEIEFNLYNSLSEKMFHINFTGSSILTTTHLQPGLYFYEIRSNTGILKSGKVVKQ